jgi:Tetratricopeptide repeat
LTSMANLGVTLIQTGHTQDGLDLIRSTYEGRRTVLGEEHPDTIMAATIVHSFATGRSA